MEFHQLWEEGWFEGAKPMLLDGEIYLMPIPGPLDSTGVTLADYAIKAVFQKGFVVRVQMPLVLGQWTDPVPDIAVLTGSVRDYAATQPTTAELVVEVATRHWRPTTARRPNSTPRPGSPTIGWSILTIASSSSTAIRGPIRLASRARPTGPSGR
jgi:hypothetical protein